MLEYNLNSLQTGIETAELSNPYLLHQPLCSAHARQTLISLHFPHHHAVYMHPTWTCFGTEWVASFLISIASIILEVTSLRDDPLHNIPL